MISPTIGRVVWFQPAHAPDKQDLTQPFAALVTYVHSDRMINVGGFDANGKPVSATSVALLQDDDAAPAHGHYASWMPYQKGQAAKHDAEKKDAADHTEDTAQQAVLGNFQLTAQLADGKSFNVSGYLFSGESVESLNGRLDLLHGVVDRQRMLSEVPELEKKIEAETNRLADYRNHMSVLVKKQEAKAGGAKVTLSSQEKTMLDQMDTNIKVLLENIDKGHKTLAEHKAKLGLA